MDNLAETSPSEIDEKDALKSVPTSVGDIAHMNIAEQKVIKHEAKDEPTEVIDTSGEVNMEASIAPDDVVRAGGFGARDDISSFLPVASDSTDFEASIRDAREYEEPLGEVSRPGLGWTEATKGE